MGKIETYVCDRCERTKGEANRWWVVSISSEGGFPNVLKMRPFKRSAAEGERTVCGIECLVKEVEEWATKHLKV